MEKYERHGHGVMKYKNGTVYHGKWHKDRVVVDADYRKVFESLESLGFQRIFHNSVKMSLFV